MDKISYETIETFIKQYNKKEIIIISKFETNNIPSNYRLRYINMDDNIENNIKNKMIVLTFFDHPYPELLTATKEIVKYTRSDGLDLNATIHLPGSFFRHKL